MKNKRKSLDSNKDFSPPTEKKVFIDTWALIAWLVKKEAYSEIVKKKINEFIKNHFQITITDYVFLEFINGICESTWKIPFNSITNMIGVIYQNIGNQSFNYEKIDFGRFQEALKLMNKYKDKKDISFTDFTSMAVMKELKIKNILTKDSHFIEVGMGFELVNLEN